MPPDRGAVGHDQTGDLAPLILAFDTSAAHCAAALLSGETCLAEVFEPMAKGQAERLVPVIDQVLAQAGCDLAQIAALAVGIGPGNFTGIRIAVATARGLALALGRPAIGVGTLAALAEAGPRPARALLDAKRGQIYLQGFGCAPAAPSLMTTEALAALAGEAALIGDGAGDLFAGLAPQPPIQPPIQPPALPLARAIGLIAGRIYSQALAQPGGIAALPRPAPLYLRGADAAPPADPPPRILDDLPGPQAQ